MIALPELKTLEDLPRDHLEDRLQALEVNLAAARYQWLLAKYEYDSAFRELYPLRTAHRYEAEAILDLEHPELSKNLNESRALWQQLSRDREELSNHLKQHPKKRGRPSSQRYLPED